MAGLGMMSDWLGSQQHLTLLYRGRSHCPTDEAGRKTDDSRLHGLPSPSLGPGGRRGTGRPLSPRETRGFGAAASDEKSVERMLIQ